MSYQLLYYIMTLLKSCTEAAFELVIDLTQVTQLNEPDVSHIFICIYVLYFLHIYMYIVSMKVPSVCTYM